MNIDDLFGIPPKNWDISWFADLEINPAKLRIEFSFEPIKYIIGKHKVEVREGWVAWRFSVDNGQSWFVFRKFEQLPEIVQESWRKECLNKIEALSPASSASSKHNVRGE